MPKVDVLGVQVDVIDTDGLHKAIIESVRRKRKDVYAYVNINAINIAQNNESFRGFLNSSHTVYCDGEGVRLGARILGYALPPRVVLTYWIWDLCALFEREKFSLFFLGGTAEAVKDATTNVRERFPGINVVGSHHGFFAKTGPDSDAVVELVRSSRPDVLVVGFGMPLQELWIQQNLERLATHVILPAGSMIEYTAGRKGLAPKWMANHGMEWVYRFFQEPGRLWKRYLIGNPVFMIRILSEFARRGKK